MLIPFYHTFAPTKPSDTEANLNVTDVRRHIRFYSPFFIDGIRSWTAQTIWSALFLLGMALTIKDIVEQVVLYLGQPTSTLTRVVFNDSIQFIEDVTFCVEIDTVRMNFIDQQRYVDGKEAREILNQFEQNPDILQFLGNLSNFDDQPARKFVALTTKMLANVLQLESYVNSNLSDYSIGLWGRASYPRHPEMYESLGSAYQFFYNRRISLSALKSAIGRLLCLQMRSSLLIFKDKKNGQSALENFDICDPQWLTWLGKCPFDEAADQLCFRYPKEMSLMKSLNDYIVLIVEPQALYNDANEMVKSKANYAYVSNGVAALMTLDQILFL